MAHRGGPWTGFEEVVHGPVRECGPSQHFVDSLPRSSQPPGHSGTVDVLLFTQFGIHRILGVYKFGILRSLVALGAPSDFCVRILCLPK